MNVLFSMRFSVYLTDALQTKTPTVRAQFRRHELAVACSWWLAFTLAGLHHSRSPAIWSKPIADSRNPRWA